MQLRQSVRRLDALATQLERAHRVHHAPYQQHAECSLVDEALRLENARLLALLRQHPPPRPVMLPQRRLRLAAAQGWRCAICGALLPESFHADHRVPFAASFDDSDANVQIVCASPCHLEKTSIEQSGRRRMQLEARAEASEQ
jgi:hypothetical protein